VAKPVIAYVEGSLDYTDENPWRDALSYFLREHHGCEILQYDHDWSFKKDLRKLKKFAASGLLVLVIVRQESYTDQHWPVIRLVRSRLSLTIPIVVLPNYDPEHPFTTNPAHHLYSFYHDDAELQELVKKVVARWKSSDWLGAETREDQAILQQQLEHAYRVHYLENEGEEDGMFGTPDTNHQVVAEALRLKLLPAMFLKEEFDDTLKRDVVPLTPAAPTIYDQELSRLKALTDKERERLEEQLLRSAGYTKAPGGGLYKTRVSLGDNVSGFALDPLTGESTTTNQFGLHRYAAEQLASRIERIEEMRAGRSAEDVGEGWRSRIVSGLIYRNIDGFTIPFLELHQGFIEPEHFKRAIQVIRDRKMFLPITNNARSLI
jgi:hypothetical protein